jgi:hypothetical protein
MQKKKQNKQKRAITKLVLNSKIQEKYFNFYGQQVIRYGESDIKISL